MVSFVGRVGKAAFNNSPFEGEVRGMFYALRVKRLLAPRNVWLTAILLTANCLLVTAQSFPVQVIPQAVPPAPIYLSNYADASTVNSPLRVQIILNDFTIANREIRLKTYFQGNGITFQSNDIVVGASPLFLEGGIPLVLTNVELAPYFEFQNITGISPNVYGQPIPEGAYQFCFEVIDVLTGNRLSNRSCALSVVFQNEPPFLVLPRNKINVDEINPQNIVFQWTPRSINVSNVEYELSLVEIWDTQVDPQQAFLSSPPVFQTTTTATTYVYGPADPLLLSGKNYAWRVQAKAKQGTEEIGLFKNQGFSEIFSFSYAGFCDLPFGINHEVKGSTNANIFWDDFTTEVPEFTVRYRQKGNNNEWFLSKTTTNQLTLWDLKAGTTYEYQVQKACVITQSDWSIVKEFTTFIADDEASVYECGITPNFSLTNMEPLPSIATGDAFVAGDFPVKILEVSGSNGRFTGKGYVTIPYLNSIKVGVEFTNVLINTDKQLAEGSVITIYDPSLSNILDIDDAIDTIDDVTDAVGEMFEGDNDLDEMRVNFPIPKDKVEDYIVVKDGIVTITNPENGASISEPLGDDKVVVDSTGQVYHIDAGGNITEGGQIDPGGAVNAGNVDGVANNGTIESLTAEGIKVTFNTPSTFGFDQMPSAATEALKKEYDIIKDAKGNDYVLPHHSVKKGGNTVITANIEIDNNAYVADSVVFKTKQGEKIPASFSGNTATLTIKGSYTFESETIYAVVPDKEDSTKQLTAGAFTLWHLTERAVKVALVSVNNASLGNIQNTVTTIFKQGVAKIDFQETLQLSFDKNNLGTNGLDVGESAWAAAYNDEQKQLVSAVKQLPGYKNDTYYILVFGDITPSRSIAGFMPLQRQMGFVFSGSANEEGKGGDKGKVLAHELGHGIFALQHPFSQYGASMENKTDWLMDYNDGIALPHMHWAQIHNPDLKFYVFQDEEDGELGGEIWFTPDWRPIAINGSSTIAYTSNSVKVKGTLPGFKTDGKRYTALFSPSGDFVDYYEDGKSDGEIYNILPVNESDLSGKDVFLFVIGTECNYAYSASYEYVIQNKSVISFDVSNNNLTKTDRIKCSNCEKGQEFISQYENIADQEIQDAIREIANLLCADSAYEHFIDALTQEGIDNLFAWQQVDYFEGLGDRSLEAFNEFKQVLENYIRFYEASKVIITTSNDRKILLKLAYNLSDAQMQALPIADKLKMLQIIASGHLSGYWTSISYNSEAIAIKIINSVQENEIVDFITGISGEDYTVDNYMLYEVLYDKIDDFFGASNFTTIAHKFNDFALKAKGLDYDILTNDQIDGIGEKRHFIWDVENADYWLVSFVNDKNPIIVTKDGNTFTLKQNCIQYLKSNYDPYGSAPPVCQEYETDISGLAPFDLVSIIIIEDINITQSNQYPFDYAISGKTTLVPVTFIQYLQTKKSNQQLTNFAFNTLTIASIYLSGAEIIAAKGLTTVAARLALADLFITFSDPYFSNPALFHTHATSVLSSDLIGLENEDAENIASALQAAWTVVSTAATINTGVEAVNPQVQMEAFATYKALVNKVGKNKAKEIISTDVKKRTKIAENFDSFEEDLVSNPELKSQLDEKVAEIENSHAFKKLDELSIGNILDDDVLTLTSGWDDDTLDLLFNDLLDAQYGDELVSALNQKPELVKAWKGLFKYQTLRINTIDLETLANYYNRTGKTVDDFAEELFTDPVLIRNWLDDLVINIYRFTFKQIDDYVGLATKQGNQSKVMLGMYDGGGANSYLEKAGSNHTYFDMGTAKWDEAKNLVSGGSNDWVDEMWEINKKFIDNQHSGGKEFWFSHDPYSPLNDQFYAREVNYLIDLGVQNFEQVGDLWKAIW